MCTGEEEDKVHSTIVDDVKEVNTLSSNMVYGGRKFETCEKCKT